jgi:hypothetical protein
MSFLYLSLRTVSAPATRAVYTLAGIEMAGAGMTDESDHFTLPSRELLETYEAFEEVISDDIRKGIESGQDSIMFLRSPRDRVLAP